MQEAQNAQMSQSIVDQTGSMLSSPMMDPQKNPDAMEQAQGLAGQAIQSMSTPPQ